MRTTNLIGILSFVILSTTLGAEIARAERAWDGSIHFVDAKIILDFHGYDHGTWDDLRQLRIYSHKGNTAGPTSISFRLVSDDGKPLQATYSGEFRITVDQKRAAIRELRFIRKSRHSGWKIDPKLIDRLKKSESPE